MLSDNDWRWVQISRVILIFHMALETAATTRSTTSITHTHAQTHTEHNKQSISKSYNFIRIAQSQSQTMQQPTFDTYSYWKSPGRVSEKAVFAGKIENCRHHHSPCMVCRQRHVLNIYKYSYKYYTVQTRNGKCKIMSTPGLSCRMEHCHFVVASPFSAI